MKVIQNLQSTGPMKDTCTRITLQEQQTTKWCTWLVKCALRLVGIIWLSWHSEISFNILGQRAKGKELISTEMIKATGQHCLQRCQSPNETQIGYCLLKE